MQAEFRINLLVLVIAVAIIYLYSSTENYVSYPTRSEIESLDEKEIDQQFQRARRKGDQCRSPFKCPDKPKAASAPKRCPPEKSPETKKKVCGDKGTPCSNDGILDRIENRLRAFYSGRDKYFASLKNKLKSP
jgi:hypothetical protein